MTTQYISNHAAPTKAKKSRKWSKRKLVFVGAVGGALLIPVAAWAAIQLFGFGTLDSVAATTKNLTVDNSSAQLIGSLVPGQTVGAKVAVSNPNDFPITVTGVIVRNSTLAVTPNSAECQSTVHVIGTAATWPGSGAGAGTLQTLGADVVIPAGGAQWVSVPNAVKQDASATVICGVHADFAVRAQTAN